MNTIEEAAGPVSAHDARGDEVSNTLKELLEHAGWLRRLAAKLVAGPHEADDIVQEVWQATLAADPSQIRAPRAWLAGAVRNVVNMRLRGEGRQKLREQQAARRELAPSAGELASEQELRKRLIENVDLLPPDEREVILLRFWRELPPRKVAKELSIPVNTVRSRTARALQRLRTQLDQQHGDRKAWCFALVPLLDESLLRTAGMAPKVMSAKALAIATVTASLLAVSAYVVYDNMTGYSLPDFSNTESASTVLMRFDSEPATASTEREDVSPPEVSATDGVMVVGSVVDLDGNAVAGAFVHLERYWIYELQVEGGKWAKADVSATTDQSGGFAMGPLRFSGAGAQQPFSLGEVTHPDYIAELEWSDWTLADAPKIVMRRAYPAELHIEVIEKGTGLPVPRFDVALAARWGKSSSPDPKMTIHPDPQQRSLAGFAAVDPVQQGADGSVRRTVRIVAGVPNLLSISVSGARAIEETLTMPKDPGARIHRRYEVAFDASARDSANLVRRGTAVDAVTGEPVVGAYVSLRCRRSADNKLEHIATTSRRDGTFALGHAPELVAESFVTSHPDYLRDEIACSGSVGLELRMRPLASLTATFTANGDPQPGVHILVHYGPSRKQPDRRRVVTNANGNVELTRLPPGTVTLYVLPKRGAVDEQALDSFVLELASGDHREQTFDFDGPDRVNLHGNVVKPGDVAIPIVPIFVPIDDDRGWIQSRALGASGYRAGGARRGRYLVFLAPASDTHRDGPFALAGVVTVNATIDQVVDLALPTGRITGNLHGVELSEDLRVVALPKLPARSLAVDQFLGSPRLVDHLGAGVDAAGRFELSRINDGVHALQLRRGDRVVATQSVNVQGGLADIGPWLIGR